MTNQPQPIQFDGTHNTCIYGQILGFCTLLKQWVDMSDLQCVCTGTDGAPSRAAHLAAQAGSDWVVVSRETVEALYRAADNVLTTLVGQYYDGKDCQIMQQNREYLDAALAKFAWLTGQGEGGGER